MNLFNISIYLKECYDALEISDVFIDPVIATLTFILGFIISNWSAKRKEKIETEKISLYFKSYYNKQIHQAKTQVIKLKEYKDKYMNLYVFENTSIEIVAQPYSIFESFNKETIFSIWINKHKRNRESYFNFCIFLEVLKNNILELQKRNEIINGELNTLREKWNTLTQIIEKDLAPYLKGKTSNDLKSNAEYLQMITEIINVNKLENYSKDLTNIYNEANKLKDNKVELIDNIIKAIEDSLNTLPPKYIEDSQ